MTNRLAAIVATGFGCGYIPLAPGTAGSALAVGMGWGITEATVWFPRPFLLLAVGALPIAIWSAGAFAQAKKQEDPQQVVVDEIVGQWITLAGATRLDWKTFLGAFVLFRIFDVWKPFPARRLESLPGGVGIVADDVIAGVYGAVVLFFAGCFNLY
jgi:phosphatidylglycerophosphatase A